MALCSMEATGPSMPGALGRNPHIQYPGMQPQPTTEGLVLAQGPRRKPGLNKGSEARARLLGPS
eukprot:15444910-Alexandrium_andersonii.AAC.2